MLIYCHFDWLGYPSVAGLAFQTVHWSIVTAQAILPYDTRYLEQAIEQIGSTNMKPHPTLKESSDFKMKE